MILRENQKKVTKLIGASTCVVFSHLRTHFELELLVHNYSYRFLDPPGSVHRNGKRMKPEATRLTEVQRCEITSLWMSKSNLSRHLLNLNVLPTSKASTLYARTVLNQLLCSDVPMEAGQMYDRLRRSFVHLRHSTHWHWLSNVKKSRVHGKWLICMTCSNNKVWTQYSFSFFVTQNCALHRDTYLSGRLLWPVGLGNTQILTECARKSARTLAASEWAGRLPCPYSWPCCPQKGPVIKSWRKLRRAGFKKLNSNPKVQ